MTELSGTRRLALFALSCAAAGAIGYGWWMWTAGNKKEVDMNAVFQANNRGVGLMEQFEYSKAAAAFERVVALAPDWLPAKINLAIAILNTAKNENFPRVRQILAEVIEREPDNPHAHFCLGIVMYHEGKVKERKETSAHFEKVIEVDPEDAATWYWLGKSLYEDDKRSRECFQKAIALDPQMVAAYHNLREKLMVDDPDGAEAALKEFQLLKNQGDETEPSGNGIGLRYSEMGKYAEVIGHQAARSVKPAVGPLPAFHRNDKLKARLDEKVRWATAKDFGNDAVGKLRARARERFGAVMVVLDYNGDGKPDLFLLGAVVDRKSGVARDLLLRNEGGGRFTDVTAEAGLDQARPSLGCCVGDFDNDGKPDLLITGAGEQHLFRNNGKGGFEDVSAKAELDRVKTICLGAAFIDLDQDGDLDLLIAQYGSIDEADKALRGMASPAGGGLAVFLNIGEALPVASKQDSPPLTTRFRRVKSTNDPDVKKPAPLIGGASAMVNMAASDLDQDRDLDLLTLSDNKPAELIVNDRLLRFHRVALPEHLIGSGRWNGALILDANRDERSDALLVGPRQSPLLLINEPGGVLKTAAKWFRKGAVKSPPLLQAQVVDLNLDGWPDVVGLSSKHMPVLLRNDGGALVHVPEALGSDKAWPIDLVALTVADFTGDGFLDLMTWSESRGVQLHVNQGNGNHALRLKLTGARGLDKTVGRKMRCPADAFGVRVVAQTKDHWTNAEYTTLSAGLGQSAQPLSLGLGQHTEAEVIRLRWMDGAYQAEMNLAADQLHVIHQTNKKPFSCPILFTWNGKRFVFVADFLGAGSLGEPLTAGGHRMPRSEESVKIEPEQLQLKDREYVLKIAEPMDEVTYLDRLELVAIDLPAGMVVYPDERFLDARTPPSQTLLVFDKASRVFPEKASDHRGRDVTDELLRWDRHTVDQFAKRSWVGLAEEHWVRLDFGKRLEKLAGDGRIYLCLAGWTDYPYPESMWAARQAGVEVVTPILERLVDDGKSWEPVVTAAGQPVDIGFPAGLPRMMTFEVTGLVGKNTRKPLCSSQCVFRLRTNMEVYWDQAFIAPLVEFPAGNRKSKIENRKCLPLSHADLSPHGLMQEYSPDGKEPTLYDFDRIERVPVSRLSGRLTRYGPVTELLGERDDCFAIFGPGDLLTVKFDARTLPPVRLGYTRSFVLRTAGYCKDCAPFTASGATVEPLPFRAMSRYPYGGSEHFPRDDRHAAYRETFNTRKVGMRAAR